jgi:GrpB-like predicted nucleotidyltransferase (UPF0157 family)
MEHRMRKSTSVPGMAAKPIIDVDVLIRSNAQFAQVCDRLERFGYIHRGSRGVEGREVFRCGEDRFHSQLSLSNSQPATRN